MESETMTLRKLASTIALREGKKSQARIGDIREIIGILSDIVYADQEFSDTWDNLHLSGEKRAKKTKTTKKKAT
jgi:hypothetical protein